jgi:hypothetical protein
MLNSSNQSFNSTPFVTAGDSLAAAGSAPAVIQVTRNIEELTKYVVLIEGGQIGNYYIVYCLRR